MTKFATKIISVLLLSVMLLAAISVPVYAEEESELQNVSLLGQAYASSIKNPAWTPAEAINDNLPDNWQGWEPLYPTEPADENGLSGEYCGLQFDSFYEIYGASMKLRNADTQDITYTIQALIMGEWQDVYVLHDHDYAGEEPLGNGDSFFLECTFDAPVNTNNIRVLCSNYAKNFSGSELVFPYIYELELYGKEGITPSVVIPEGYSITSNLALTGEIVASSAATDHWPALIIDKDSSDKAWMAAADDTNAQIGVKLAEAVDATGISLNFGTDAAAISYTVSVLYENGVKAQVHDGTVADGEVTILFDTALCITEVTVAYEGIGAQLKELSVVSSYNAAENGTVSASSAKSGYAATELNSGDGLWKAASTDTDASVSIALENATLPNAIVLDFGAGTASVPYKVFVTRETGTVSEVFSGTASDGVVSVDTSSLARTGAFITAVEVVFDGKNAQLKTLEVQADHFTLALSEETDDTYKQSCAKGNLAILGTAYAESSFPNYSQIEYINDGLFSDTDKSWYAHGSAVPTYCGIKLDKTYTINKIDLTFASHTPAGANVMSFDIQALVNGEYVTIVSGQSYCKDGKYEPVYVFDPIQTDDVRIVFTSNGGIFPNVCEIEIYSATDFPVLYMGYPVGSYSIGGRAVTVDDTGDTSNIVYDTTTRDSNPPMLGSPEATTPIETTPTETTPISSATDPGDISTPDDPTDPMPWVVVVIVFAVCGGAVAIYLIVKRKKA